MQRLIRKELEAMFFEAVATDLRCNNASSYRWRMVETNAPIIIDRQGKPIIKSHSTIDFLNEEIIIYLETSTILKEEFCYLGRYLYRAWLQLDEGRPPFQRGGFITKPMQ